MSQLSHLPVDVRVAGPLDVAETATLLLAQLREHDIPVSLEHVTARVRNATDAGDPLILLGVSGDSIVGVAYVSFATPLEHAGTVAWLEELYVRPDRRERGVGARLVAAVLEHAERSGCVAVELETKRGHERAANLYRRHGFRDLGRAHYARPLRAWDWGLLSR